MTSANPVPGTYDPVSILCLTCPRGAAVAHLFGKEEVMGPTPIVGSISFAVQSKTATSTFLHFT